MPNNFKNKKVLVTGCAGFIPSFVAQAFLQKGALVFGVDDLSTGSRENMKEFIKDPHFEFIQKDIVNKNLVELLIKKVNLVYHGAVQGVGISVKNPVCELEVNTKSTLLILEAVRKYKKVERFVFPSSASVYGNPKKIPESEEDLTLPLSPYGVSKLAAERYCLAYYHLFNIPVVCLRYFNIYGPRQRKDSIYGGVISIFIYNALQNKPLNIYGNGKQTRDFTYIDDAIKATIKSFTAPNILGKVINICQGKEYSINELAQKIKEVSKKKNLPLNYVPKRLVDNIERRCGDIRLAHRMINYEPRVSLEEGLTRTYKWNKSPHLWAGYSKKVWG